MNFLYKIYVSQLKENLTQKVLLWLWEGSWSVVFVDCADKQNTSRTNPPRKSIDSTTSKGWYPLLLLLLVLCVSCVNPRVDIHCDCVSCLLFAPPLIIPCLTTHQLSFFDMGYLAEVRVEVWTCIILGSKGFPCSKKYSLPSGRIVRIPSICTQYLLTVCKWYPLRNNTRHKSNVFSVYIYTY